MRSSTQAAAAGAWRSEAARATYSGARAGSARKRAHSECGSSRCRSSSSAIRSGSALIALNLPSGPSRTVGVMDRKWWTLIAVSIATFMLLLDITIVNVALPEIERALGSSFSDLQWVIDAYALTLTALLLTGGSLGDLSAPPGVRDRDRDLHRRVRAVRARRLAAVPQPRPRAPRRRRRVHVRVVAGAAGLGLPGPRPRHRVRRLGRGDRGVVRRRPAGRRRADRRHRVGGDLPRQRADRHRRDRDDAPRRSRRPTPRAAGAWTGRGCSRSRAACSPSSSR